MHNRVLKRLTVIISILSMIILPVNNTVYAEETNEDCIETESIINAALLEAKEGVDYPENIVIMPASSKSEAEYYALKYSELTGYTVTLKDYSYGVATLKLAEGVDANELNNSIGNVAAFTIKVNSLADDYNLPYVEPDYYVSIDDDIEISDTELQLTTDEESICDFDNNESAVCELVDNEPNNTEITEDEINDTETINYSDEYLNPASNKYQFFHISCQNFSKFMFFFPYTFLCRLYKLLPTKER